MIDKQSSFIKFYIVNEYEKPNNTLFLIVELRPIKNSNKIRDKKI